MFDGLMGSLDMMEKVLNDVLSFDHMSEGKFEQARNPFDFHKVIKVVALLHRVHAEHAGLDFELDMDPNIDNVGGIVVGDEMRLRQLTSNLIISNALKFVGSPTFQIVANHQTRVGGVRIATRLVWMTGGDSLDPCSDSTDNDSPERVAAIRVEVHDTGVGLRPEDVQNNRLFSPYVQTEIGRRQGGKGSGLGLALVHQIVRLSGGRLGVESEVGKGSTFWFEIPYMLFSCRGLPRLSSDYRRGSLDPNVVDMVKDKGTALLLEDVTKSPISETTLPELSAGIQTTEGVDPLVSPDLPPTPDPLERERQRYGQAAAPETVEIHVLPPEPDTLPRPPPPVIEIVPPIGTQAHSEARGNTPLSLLVVDDDA
jgi:hypothetical protein